MSWFRCCRSKRRGNPFTPLQLKNLTSGCLGSDDIGDDTWRDAVWSAYTHLQKLQQRNIFSVGELLDAMKIVPPTNATHFYIRFLSPFDQELGFCFSFHQRNVQFPVTDATYLEQPQPADGAAELILLCCEGIEKDFTNAFKSFSWNSFGCFDPQAFDWLNALVQDEPITIVAQYANGGLTTLVCERDQVDRHVFPTIPPPLPTE
jgi:hypothetical protein